MRLTARLALALWTAAGLWAQSASMKVIASNGIREVVEELRPKLEKATGRPFTAEYGTTTELVRKIDGGAPFDVVLMTAEGVAGVSKSGHAGAPVELARCGVGIGIRAGSKKPSVATSADMKALLLGAKSVTWAKEGASRPFVDKMLADMGITQQMAPKIVLAAGSGAATSSVAEGKVDVVLTLISEIVGVKGVVMIGGLPAPHQQYVRFAGAPAKAQDASAKTFLATLGAADSAPVYKSKGMEAASAYATTAKGR